MNITIFPHAYSPSVGGVEEVVRNLCREFKLGRHRLQLIVFTPIKKFIAREVIEGIEVYRFYTPFVILPYRIGWRGFLDIAKMIFFLPLSLLRLARVLRKNNTQIIHVHYIGVNALYTWLLSYFLPLKYIVSLHGFSLQAMPFLKGISKSIIEFLFKSILKRACFVTACSEYLLNDARERVPDIGEKSSVISNGIELEEFNHNGRALVDYPYILCLGRLHPPFKGFDIALLALKDILDSGFDIKLVLAGDGPARLSYQRLAKLLGIDKKVYFFGSVDRKAAVNLIRNCEFFLMPSRVEPLGIVNLEAMACSKAVIASRTGGIPEVVDDNATGLLVEPNNEKALAKAIQKLLTDKTLRDRLGRNGRSKLEQGNFSWKVIAGKHLEISKRFINYES